MVIVVHVNQESGGHGTMNWHNALTKFGHLGVNTPDVAPYSEVAKILNDKFFYSTGRGLTLKNLQHISRESFVVNGNVTMKAFLKEQLPNMKLRHQKDDKDRSNKPPSYWDWFYECNKLTTTSFKENWRRGLIEGFIPRDYAEDLLSHEPIGTFMMRFSQTMVGVISIMNNYGDAPFLWSNDFKDKTLDQCMLGYDSLTTLYPGIAKEDVFFSIPPPAATPDNSGYVRVQARYHIER